MFRHFVESNMGSDLSTHNDIQTYYHFYTFSFSTFRGLDTFGKFSAILYKGYNVCNFPLASCTKSLFWKEVYYKRKVFSPEKSKLFLFRVYSFSKARQNSFHREHVYEDSPTEPPSTHTHTHTHKHTKAHTHTPRCACWLSLEYKDTVFSMLTKKETKIDDFTHGFNHVSVGSSDMQEPYTEWKVQDDTYAKVW